MPEAIAISAFVSEFAGDFPALATPHDINLTELEDGGAPFFVTLPIIPEIGAVSGNGLLYDEALAASIEEQINSKRPGANFGHLASDQRDSAFPHPKAFWVAAQRVGSTLWAKAYVPVGEARQHLRNLKAMGGRIATSIFGRGDFEEVSAGVRRLSNFALETIDFAPPERAALGYGAPVMVTSEMTELDVEEETIMDIQELLAVKVPPQKGWQTPKGQSSVPLKGWKAPVQEMQGDVNEMASIRAALGVPEGVSVAEMVNELRGQVVTLTQAAVTHRIVEMVEEGVRLPDARDLVADLIMARNPQSVEDAEAAYQAVIEMESVKKILALSVRASMGPAAIVSGRVASGRPKLEDTPEARAKAAAAMGFNI